MKKYTLFLLILTFVFGSFNINVNSAHADDSGCMTGDNFSRTTGQPCGGNTTLECRAGDLFSSVTGKPCSNSNNGDAFCRVLFNQELKIGSKGDDVKTLQQTLKDGGFLSGKVDGVYGPVTNGARIRYYKRCPIPVPCPPIDAKELTDYICPPKPIDTQSPVISGVNGPQSLNVNQQGTWSVTASSPDGGNLWYSVAWGDEPQNILYGLNQPSAMTVQQSATFTHSYSQAGVYTQVFKVTNSGGQSAQTSLSVNVGGVIRTSSYVTVLSPNGGETWTKGTTQTIKWQDTGTNACVTGSICTPSYEIQLVPFSPIYPVPACSGKLCPLYPYIEPVSHTIATNVTGSLYQWTIPNCTASNPCSSNFEIASGSYMIQICRSGTGVCDSSDNYFKIVNETTTVPTIYSLDPPSTMVGFQVNIIGNGFTPTGNHVHFSYQDISDLSSSNNGTTLVFTVPNVIGVNCSSCGAPASAVVPGTYTIYVSNAGGTSNSANLIVTSGISYTN